MIKTVLFVHGTGVRHASYVETSARVVAALDAMSLGIVFRPCAWGDKHGAELPVNGGMSIPDYEGPISSASLDETQTLALWQILAHDPLFELRLRTAMGESTFVSSIEKERKETYKESVKSLACNASVMATFSGQALSTPWQEAVRTVVGAEPYQNALTVATTLDADLRISVARAIVAAFLQQLNDANMPQLVGPKRDSLVDLCVDSTGGHALGVKDWIKDWLIGFGLRMATNAARRRRDALYNAAYPGAGDILLYQARGDAIRNYIADRIAECEGDVAILAHSLGAIACVDLLVERPQERVKLLVTVGSQTPFLYEIDALPKLRRGESLPDHFPQRWLNFYDTNDLLSFRAAPVFIPRARDCKIVSGQPFPYCHSSYWEMPLLWETLKAELST